MRLTPQFLQKEEHQMGGGEPSIKKNSQPKKDTNSNHSLAKKKASKKNSQSNITTPPTAAITPAAALIAPVSLGAAAPCKLGALDVPALAPAVPIGVTNAKLVITLFDPLGKVVVCSTKLLS